MFGWIAGFLNPINWIKTIFVFVVLVLVVRSLSSTKAFKASAGSSVVAITDTVNWAGEAAGITQPVGEKTFGETVSEVPVYVSNVVQYFWKNGMAMLFTAGMIIIVYQVYRFFNPVVIALPR
jgi:hypothetical protein